MAKNLGRRMGDRMNRPHFGVIERVSIRLEKLLGRFEHLFENQKNANAIERVLVKQLEFHAKTFLEAIETLRASQGNRREDEEIFDAAISGMANALTPIAGNNFVEAYIKSDPETSAIYLNNVGERALKGGAGKCDREQLLQIHRWLSEVLNVS